jgi:hypothetical protein
MSKGEDLFGGVDLNFGSDEMDDGVDVSEFEEGANVDTVDDVSDDVDSSSESKDENEEVVVNNDEFDSAEFEKDNSSQESDEDNNSVDDDSSADNSSSPLQLIASTLQAEGVIDLEEGEKITSSKQILDAVRSKIEKNEFADLNEDQKSYIEALREGIPEADIKQNQQNIRALNGITDEAIESNEELRKTLITQGLIADGLSEAKAIKSANRIMEAGDDLEEARDAYKTLKEVEGSRIAKDTSRLKEEAVKNKEVDAVKLASLKTNILETEEFIKGIKVNSSTREKVFNTMTKIVSHDKEGNPLNAINAARHKNPEQMEKMESYLFNLTNGFTDFKIFKNKMKSSSIKELDSQLQGTQAGGGSSKSVSKQNQGGLAGAIGNLKL